MKRFVIEDVDGYVLKLYYSDIEEAKRKNPDCTINEYIDYSHSIYCNAIRSASTETILDYKGRIIYKIPLSTGYVLVRLYIDPQDDTWYDYCEYQQIINTQLVLPVTFTMSTPKEFCQKYLINPIKYELLSFRKHGEAKLSKPAELKGVKQSGSVVFIPDKCKCPYFVVGNDIYIKHGDYFSPTYCKQEDIGTSLGYRCKKYGIGERKNKFIYDDNWGSIVLRQEAWIKIENVLSNLYVSNVSAVTDNILRQIENMHGFEENSLEVYWKNMFEDLLKAM